MEEAVYEYASRISGNVDPSERPKVELLLPVSVVPFARMQAKVGLFTVLAEQSQKPLAITNTSSNLLIKN